MRTSHASDAIASIAAARTTAARPCSTAGGVADALAAAGTIGARLLLIALVAGLCGGCQRTLFSQPPATAAGCDRALQGHWLSIAEDGSPDGEIEATLDAACMLSVVEHGSEGARAWPDVRLASARVGRRDLLWLDAASVNRAFGIERTAVDRGDTYYVFAYQRDGERLDLLQPDHHRFARRVIDGALDGAVLVDGRDIAVRLDVDAGTQAALLGERRSFKRGNPLRFRRGPGALEH